MGAVRIDEPDSFRHSLIGLAPLIFGSIAVLLIGYGVLGLGQVGEAFLSGNLERTWRGITGMLSVPDVWLWFYLIFAISNAMLPSASDREAWHTVLIYLGLTLFLAIGLGVTPGVPPKLQALGLTVLTYLLIAFTITIVLDLFVIALILFIEIALGLVLGRRIQYGG